MSDRADIARPVGRGAAVVSTLLSGVLLLFAYLDKARCAGPPFDDDGRSAIFDYVKDSRVCYSDIQFLWLGRAINEHVFPYIGGGITPDGTLTGGVVEYPVLSGLLMWLGALGVHDDAGFLLHSALLLAPFGLVTAWLLGRLSGSAALLWSVTPPLLLYAFHNWELPVVCTSVAAIYVVTVPTRYSLRARGIAAAVLLAIGFCLKLYPGMFLAPLLLYVLVRGDEPRDDQQGGDERGGDERGGDMPGGYGRRNPVRGYDVRGALAVAGAAVATAVAINLPFAVAGYQGWRASFTYQQLREVDITTNSIWYWGLRPLFETASSGEASFQGMVSVASPVLVVVSFLVALGVGWRRHRSGAPFPWVGVSGAMLCGFLLFHKVHSPQYTLWLIPFLVLWKVPWPAVAGYLVADAALGIGVFRYFSALGSGGSAELEEHVVQFGVWGCAALLAVFFVAFLRAGPRRRAGVQAPVSGDERSEPVPVRG